MIKLKELLETHHGRIDTILLSYCKADSPEDMKSTEYKKWFEDTNKKIKVNMDLQHTSQKLKDFKELQPYLNLKVWNWDLFKKQR